MFLRSLFFTGLLIFSSGCTAKVLETQIFLIPEGYVGDLVIIYGVPSAKEPVYESDVRVYKYDASGVHLTQLNFPSGTGNSNSFQFYYVDNSGNRSRVLLSNLFEDDEIKNSVEDPNIYAMQGVIGSTGSVPCDFRVARFYIGTYRNVVDDDGVVSLSDYVDANPDDPCIKVVSPSDRGCCKFSE